VRACGWDGAGAGHLQRGAARQPRQQRAGRGVRSLTRQQRAGCGVRSLCAALCAALYRANGVGGESRVLALEKRHCHLRFRTGLGAGTAAERMSGYGALNRSEFSRQAHLGHLRRCLRCGIERPVPQARVGASAKREPNPERRSAYRLRQERARCSWKRTLVCHMKKRERLVALPPLPSFLGTLGVATR